MFDMRIVLVFRSAHALCLFYLDLAVVTVPTSAPPPTSSPTHASGDSPTPPTINPPSSLPTANTPTANTPTPMGGTLKRQPLKDNWFRKREMARKRAFPQRTAWFRKQAKRNAASLNDAL